MPGPSSNEPLTLSFGVTNDMTFWTWFTDVKGSVRNRQHLSIFAYGRMDPSTSTKFFAQWDLLYAWPCKISGLNFDLDSDAAFITEVTLMHEGISRVA
jgi:phage tail-like protein